MSLAWLYLRLNDSNDSSGTRLPMKFTIPLPKHRTQMNPETKAIHKKYQYDIEIPFKIKLGKFCSTKK
jgi:hypothetical protein